MVNIPPNVRADLPAYIPALNEIMRPDLMLLGPTRGERGKGSVEV